MTEARYIWTILFYSADDFAHCVNALFGEGTVPSVIQGTILDVPALYGHRVIEMAKELRITIRGVAQYRYDAMPAISQASMYQLFSQLGLLELL